MTSGGDTMKRAFIVLVGLLFFSSQQSVDSQNISYAPNDDASWAIQSPQVSSMLGEDKPALFKKYMEGCNEAVSKSKTAWMDCYRDDNYRVEMNRHQPSSVRNFTKTGYKKIRAPPELFDLIQSFYNENKDHDEIEWKTLNTYHNMWESPPTILHMNQPKFKGGGPQLQSEIWRVAKQIMEEWSGQALSPVSLYGIRLYHNGSILAPHVDRFPLVTSAIINVDQDVEEPWPLEVYGHDGKATNVTMAPGDMVLYESHSVIHGRPFPLKGKYFANVFVHFEPVANLDGTESEYYYPELDLPPYLIAGSVWESEWRANNRKGWKGHYLDAHAAAQKGDVEALRRIAKTNPTSFTSPDDNGWTPFHEAVRVGNKEAVEIILNSEVGKSLQNRLTYTGVTPLNIAREFLGNDNEVTKFLVELGAIDKHPHRRGSVTGDEL